MIWQTEKFPNLRDGLALSYAAANKGQNRAAKRAREVAKANLQKNGWTHLLIRQSME